LSIPSTELKSNNAGSKKSSNPASASTERILALVSLPELEMIPRRSSVWLGGARLSLSRTSGTNGSTLSANKDPASDSCGITSVSPRSKKNDDSHYDDILLGVQLMMIKGITEHPVGENPFSNPVLTIDFRCTIQPAVESGRAGPDRNSAGYLSEPKARFSGSDRTRFGDGPLWLFAKGVHLYVRPTGCATIRSEVKLKVRDLLILQLKDLFSVFNHGFQSISAV
jgi:hypothetical protein